MTRLSICALVAVVVISNVNARCPGGGGGTNGPMMKGAEVDFNRDIKAKVGGKIKFGPCGRPKSVVNADIKDCGRSNIKGNAFQMLETAGRMAEVLKLVGSRFKPHGCCPPKKPCPHNDDESSETLCDGALKSRVNSPLCNLKQVGGSGSGGNKRGYRKSSARKSNGGGNDLSLSPFDSRYNGHGNNNAASYNNNMGSQGGRGKYSKKYGGVKKGSKKSYLLSSKNKRKNNNKRYNHGVNYNNGGHNNKVSGRGYQGSRGGNRGLRNRPTETRTHTSTVSNGGNDNDYSVSASMVDSDSFESDAGERGRDYDTGDNGKDGVDDTDYDGDYDLDDYTGHDADRAGDNDYNEVDDADRSHAGVKDVEYDDASADNDSARMDYEVDDNNVNVDEEEEDYTDDYESDTRGHHGHRGGDYDASHGGDYSATDYSDYSGVGSNDNVSPNNEGDEGIFPRPKTIPTYCSNKNTVGLNNDLYPVPSFDIPSRSCLHHIPLGGTKSCNCQQNQVYSGSSRGANCNNAGAGGAAVGSGHGSGGSHYGNHGHSNGHQGGSNNGGGYKPCGCH